MQNFLQPFLENENVQLVPLQENDFEALYEVASDPLIWEQHPSKDRYKIEVFTTFFKGALASGGAFKIIDKSTNEIAGSTRFYGLDENENSVFIGYTFYARKFWGSKLNPQVKKLMLDYIFNHVELVKLHVGSDNFRSRKAIERLGAENRGEVLVAYHGEVRNNNVEYWIRKENWVK